MVTGFDTVIGSVPSVVKPDVGKYYGALGSVPTCLFYMVSGNSAFTASQCESRASKTGLRSNLTFPRQPQQHSTTDRTLLTRDVLKPGIVNCLHARADVQPPADWLPQRALGPTERRTCPRRSDDRTSQCHSRIKSAGRGSKMHSARHHVSRPSSCWRSARARSVLAPPAMAGSVGISRIFNG